MQTFNRKLFYAFIAFTLCMNISVSFAGKWPKELAKGVMSYTKGEQKYGKPECAGEWSPKGKPGEKGNMVKACPIVKGAEKSWYKIEYKDEANGDYGTAVRDYPEMNIEIEDGSVWVVGTHG